MTILLIFFIMATIFFAIKYVDTKNRIKALKENLEFQEQCKSVAKCPIGEDVDLLEISKRFDDLQCKIITLENEKEELEKEYQKITSDLSHDLRTPLTSILGYLDLMKKDPANAWVYLETVEEKTAYLKELVDALYELFLIMEKEYQDVQYLNIKELATEKAFFYYDKLTEKNQEMAIDAPGDITIYTSKEGLEKIFTNAIDNMLKYSQGDNRITIGEKPFTIRFSNITDLEDGEYNTFFDRFKVGDLSRKNATGIGLSIVKNLGDKLGFSTKIDVKNHIFTLTIQEK